MSQVLGLSQRSDYTSRWNMKVVVEWRAQPGRGLASWAPLKPQDFSYFGEKFQGVLDYDYFCNIC